MEDFIEIIILILISAAGLVQGLISENKKKKKKAAAAQSAESFMPDLHVGEKRVPGNWQILPDNTSPDTENAVNDNDETRPSPTVIYNTNTRPRIKIQNDITSITESQLATEETSTVINPLLNDFDLRKAILYSEILKPKF